jgi:hypothetical protein
MSNNIWPEFVGFSTPIIPEEIRAIRHPAYKNIFEYELGNENLWGTETLFGDWAGHTESHLHLTGGKYEQFTPEIGSAGLHKTESHPSTPAQCRCADAGAPFAT